MKYTEYQDLKGNFIQSDNKIRPGNVIHGQGTIVQLHSDKQPARSQCRGCYDDYYNLNDKGCWSFSSAQVCDKIGYSSIHVPNGPDTIKENTLSCWHAVSK